MTTEASFSPSNGVASAVAVTAAAAVLTGLALYNRAHRIKEVPDESSSKVAGCSKPAETWESHVPKKHGPLREVWPGTLFILEAEGTGQGPPVRNMVVYRLPPSPMGDGQKEVRREKLVIYNGIAVDETTISKIESLGVPAVLIVPNCYHRCCAFVWKQRYPEITVVCPPAALEEASKVIHVDATTTEWAGMPEWKGHVGVKAIDGWADFESVIELDLEACNPVVVGKKQMKKKAMLVCDLLFTVPYPQHPTLSERFLFWLFDSYVVPLPKNKKSIIIPKVARLSRIFAVKDWKKAEQWYRSYAEEDGAGVGTIIVGHGPPVLEVDSNKGCAEALLGVANQLMRPRW